MGIQTNGRGTVIRQPRAHLERTDNGDVYAILKLGFRKDERRYRYCFIGEDKGTLTFDGKVIAKHPAFKNISQFEGWCMRYTAEHDL